MYKLMRSDVIEPRYMVGVDPRSDGLRKGPQGRDSRRPPTGSTGCWARQNCPTFVFEATSAYVHVANAPRYAEHGHPGDRPDAGCRRARSSCRAPTSSSTSTRTNVNMVTCAGQATIPIVHAVAAVTEVDYAEIVATVASVSAGPGTRANIDEFTRTTSRAIADVGRAGRGKAIIVLNPADPPLIMRDTIFCQLPRDADEILITKAVEDAVANVAQYVPGYRLKSPPQFGESRDGTTARCGTRSRWKVPVTTSRRTPATSTS